MAARHPKPSKESPAGEFPAGGRARAVIENIAPAVDGGRFAIKRVVGEPVVVEADCFADGHDSIGCAILYRRDSEAHWHETPMAALGNDRWRGTFTVGEVGRYRYAVTAWTDAFLSWRHDFARRVEAQDLRIAAVAGADLVAAAGRRAAGADRDALTQWAARLRAELAIPDLRILALDPELSAIASRYPDRHFATTTEIEYPVVVDRERARFSTWYELFPRSCGSDSRTHGTLRDCAARLPYVAGMGFDVIYLPPIHPIGRERRKGRNNTLEVAAGDVGSPWAIGAAEGGHTAIHPELGGIEDFRDFAASARKLGLELALDIAFQCAPDHPWVTAHPSWFRRRPDGTVQYAENPPKKYQDIYPLNFESDDWTWLWSELESVFAFWLREGVRIFRVDNPHTKPFVFWEWVIGRIKTVHPEAIFLSEAFTRPKVMHRLAKLGFTQSYTYFTWRNTKDELTAYFDELTHGPGREYLRPNCWPNTPDILPEPLQFGGRATFMARLVLAATLAANYGIYGPAFELLEHAPREPGTEEYLDSEKYEVRQWDLARPDSLADFIGRVNAARRDNPALQHDGGLTFLPIDNDQMIAYAKVDPAGDNAVVVIVNLDPHHTQSGWVTIDPAGLGLEGERAFQVHDVLTGARFLWSGTRNFVQLDPARVPAHLFRLRRRVRTERDFDYFL